jgi:hypothetical protein
MTIESGFKALRELNLGTPRRRYPQFPAVAAEDSGAVSQLHRRPPAHHADAAQARQFIGLLRAEHAELATAAATLETLRFGSPSTSHQMRSLQADMTEIRQLLNALDRRFPSS